MIRNKLQPTPQLAVNLAFYISLPSFLFQSLTPTPAPSVSLGLTSMRSSVVRELRTLLALKLLCSDRGP